MKSVMIVYCIDDNYFHLLEDNLISLGETIKNFDIGIIDIGLSEENKDRIRSYNSNVTFVEPGWKIDYPGREKSPLHKQGTVARCFIAELFPGYDGYFYSDADVWFPDETAISDYIEASGPTGAAFGIEAHPTYKINHTLRHRSFRDWHINYGYKSHLFSNCIKLFGPRIAYKMAKYSFLNAGIFYMDRDSPIWAAWIDYSKRAKLSPSNLSNQACLHVAIVEENLPYAAMPATHNWLPAKGVPAIDPVSRKLVDASFPYPEIKAIHLTDKSEKRTFELLTTDGQERVQTRLTRSAFADWQAEDRLKRQAAVSQDA